MISSRALILHYKTEESEKMKIKQIYTGCISHAAYYVESKGEAAIFDPLRDTQPYIDKAKADDAVIKYVFETHFHADFVSGHLDLMNKTGAKIVFGPTAIPNYDAIIAEDNQIFEIGDIKIQVLHTPGHTMESTTYLIYDESGKKHAIITGDTLFIGDVGRPDLVQLVKSDLTEEILARHLFRSLRDKIMTQPDHLIVYPNHGAGSACGKNMSKETMDTLGNQKQTNYALRADMTEDEFVKEVLFGLTTPPQYFPKNVLMNIGGYESLDKIMERANQSLSLTDFEHTIQNKDVLILDTRDASDFAVGFIPGSINIGLNGPFATWVGELIADIKQLVVLVADKGKEEESIIRLSRVGYDCTIGYLTGGFDTWKNAGKEIEKIERISPVEMDKWYIENADRVLLDVRKTGEYEIEHLKDAVFVPLNKLELQINSLNIYSDYIIYCAGGYRSMIAASLMLKSGFKNVCDVSGGYGEIAKYSKLRKESLTTV